MTIEKDSQSFGDSTYPTEQLKMMLETEKVMAPTSEWIPIWERVLKQRSESDKADEAKPPELGEYET